MQINSINQVSQIYSSNQVGKTTKTGKTSTKDDVSFSSFGIDLQTAKKALAAVPDVREDKVSSLKSKIDSGNYSVSGSKFADKLLAAYNEKAI